jgi:hypothetical protein
MSRTLHSSRHEALRAFLVEKHKKAGLTQAVVAGRLKRYQSFVATVEAGQRKVDAVELLDFAEAIGFDPREAKRGFLRLATRRSPGGSQPQHQQYTSNGYQSFGQTNASSISVAVRAAERRSVFPVLQNIFPVNGSKFPCTIRSVAL